MDKLKSLTEMPYFKEVAFLAGVLLVLGAWKFGIEGLGE
jgi:hypothetical protein